MTTAGYLLAAGAVAAATAGLWWLSDASSSGTAEAAPRAEAPAAWAKADLKAGIIGCDTSHVPAFTAEFKHHPQWRVKVVAAFPGGSKDMPKVSLARIPGFVQTIHEKDGVQIVGSIDELLKRVDVVLIESVDGRTHLAEARKVIAAGKPMFIDKPFTANLADARELIRLAQAADVPFFSSSCVRFQPQVARLRHDAGVGKVLRVQGSSPLHIEPHNPDLFWYGIHGVEALYTVMGPGCVSVTRKWDKDTDWTTGRWKDGRIGVFRGVIHGDYRPLVEVWGKDGEVDTGKLNYSYAGLCENIARFFQTKKPPVDPAETLEIIEFMTAAHLSKERGGAEVRLDGLGGS